MGANAIATALISHPKSLTSLLLDENELVNIDKNGKGTFEIYGLLAVLDAVKSSKSLTELSLAENQLCGINALGFGSLTFEGMKAISDTLCHRTQLTRLVLRGNRLNTQGGALLAAALKKASLTALSISGCNLSNASGKAITDALHQNASLTYVSTANNKLGPTGKSIAEVVATNSTTSRREVGYDDLRKSLEHGGFKYHGLSVLSLPKPKHTQSMGALPSLMSPRPRDPLGTPRDEAFRPMSTDPATRLPPAAAEGQAKAGGPRAFMTSMSRGSLRSSASEREL